MTQEEKELLIKDLCARLPYSTDILTEDDDKGHIIGVDDVENGVFEIHIIEDGDSYTCYESIEKFKPYLRPMSSMTVEEKEVVCSMNMISDTELNDRLNYQRMYVQNYTIETFDYFNERKLDYRGLIPMGLALEAPEGMYKNE